MLNKPIHLKKYMPLMVLIFILSSFDEINCSGVLTLEESSRNLLNTQKYYNNYLSKIEKKATMLSKSTVFRPKLAKKKTRLFLGKQNSKKDDDVTTNDASKDLTNDTTNEADEVDEVDEAEQVDQAQEVDEGEEVDEDDEGDEGDIEIKSENSSDVSKSLKILE